MSKQEKQKNSVVMIEPRIIPYVIPILNEYYKFLGDDWNYVFYCGKNTSTKWKNVIEYFKPPNIDFREVHVDNFTTPAQYSDFLKQKSVWESLEGEFILTVQIDTWPMNFITIDTFINLNQSFIGGNMVKDCTEMIKESVNVKFPNGNGGLSLRKRLDMIKVIDAFPPKATYFESMLSPCFEMYAEDMYFYIGCYRLGLPIGDDEISSTFALHTVPKDKYFAIHNPSPHVMYLLYQTNPELEQLNPHLKLSNAYRLNDL